MPGRDMRLDPRALAIRAAIGVAGASGVAALGRRAGGLSQSGALAATVAGAVVVTGGGYRAGAALITFFATSTLLGRMPAHAGIAAQRRGNQRDAVQVVANGGIPALLAAASALSPSPVARRLGVGLAAAIAAAAADTWATEVGSRFGRHPRSIITFRPVTPGTSGGVSSEGLVASIAGAALIAAVSVDRPGRVRAAACGGIAGALIDSALGATVQEVRWCPDCREETELGTHGCGATTRHRRGFAWCTNDAVNLISGAAGALIGMACAPGKAGEKAG